MNECEYYKQLIMKLVEKSKDAEYLAAVLSFAENYPDKSKEN